MPVIPTRFKSKIPGTVSYPVGAEAISAALAGVPQFDVIQLWFSGLPGWRASAHQAILRGGRPYLVLQATYDHRVQGPHASKSMVESGWYGKQWKISVYAVPREHRAAVRTLQTERGLPRVREWLAQPGTDHWGGYHELSLTFDPRSGDLTEGRPATVG